MSNIAVENPFVKPFLEIPGKYTTQVLDETIRSGFVYSELYHRQQYIADRIGCVRATVNRAYGYLHAHGFIKKTNRGVKKTCVYVLSDVIIRYAHLLRDVFTSLKYVWNVTDLFDLWGPATKAAIKNNFKKMLHNNKNNNLITHYDPDMGYVDSHLLMTDPKIFQKNNLATEELEEIFSKTKLGDVQVIAERTVEVPLSPIGNQIADELQLTEWGRMKITPFEDEALQSTIKQLSHAKPRNVFKWFIDNCVTYSKMNNLRMNWSNFYELRDRHNMPSNPKFIKEKTVSHQSQSRSPFLTLEPEQPKEERDAYVTDQYMHFEVHREQPDKDKIDRTYVHPMFKDVQNPFLKEYNVIREERGLEKLPEKDTNSWSIFEFEAEERTPQERGFKSHEELSAALEFVGLIDKAPTKEVPTGETLNQTPKENTSIEDSNTSSIKSMVHTSMVKQEQPYMSDDSPWEEV